MGSLYSEQHTWLHAVPAYVKLLCLALLGTGLFFTDQLHMLLMASACQQQPDGVGRADL